MVAEHPSARRVTVAVPTFHRNAELRRLLAALLPQLAETAAGGEWDAEVLVIDNDPAGGGRAVAEELSPSADGRLRYVLEGTPGLAAVRNRALDEADGRLLVFLDDDEEPAPDWLGTMLAMWAHHGSAAVFGRVVSVFEMERDAWLVAGRAFIRPAHRTGDRLPAVATNNLLLDLDVVRRLGLRFDTRLAFSGGEDSLFTTQLTRGGGTILWCDEAVVYEHVPQDRLNRRWILTRAYRNGTVEETVARLAGSGPAHAIRVRLQYLLGGVVRVVGGSGRVLLGRVTGKLTHVARGERAVARGAGMVAGAAGFVYQEYAKRTAARRSA